MNINLIAVKRYACAAVLITTDLLAWIVAFYVATEGSVASLDITLMAFWTFWVLFNNRNYIKRQTFWVELRGLILGALTFFIFSVIAAFLYGQYDATYYHAKLTCLLVIGLPLARVLTRSVLIYFDLWTIPTVIFGAGENSRQAVLALNSESALGFKVIALIPPVGADVRSVSDKLVIAWPACDKDFKYLQDKHCVIAVEAYQGDLRDDIIRSLSEHNIREISVIPAMRGVPLFGLDTTQFFSHEVLMLNFKIQLSKPLLRLGKRLFDLIGAAVLLTLLSPLFVFFTWKITRDGGAAYFGHERVGFGGKPFKCYKFRSMVMNAQEVLEDLLAQDSEARSEWQKDFKLKNDPRVTSLGLFLRKTSLDELPQLWNVFKGDMSLVGPRPIVQAELERYGRDAIYYLMTRPGMTGLWQISGRNDVDYETRVYFDSWYVKNWSVWTDVAILFKTIGVVAGRKGAY